MQFLNLLNLSFSHDLCRRCTCMLGTYPKFTYYFWRNKTFYEIHKFIYVNTENYIIQNAFVKSEILW